MDDDRPLDASDIFRASEPDPIIVSPEFNAALLDDLVQMDNEQLSGLIITLAAERVKFRAAYFDALAHAHTLAIENARLRASQIAQREIAAAVHAETV